MTTTAQQTALEKVKVSAAYFLELDFSGGFVRVCSYGQNYDWGGFTWTGLGTLGQISPVDESSGVGSSSMTFSLNIADAAILALAVGITEAYRGRTAKLYFCPLDDTGVLIDTPEIAWRGTMDVMSVGIDGSEGQVSLRCETSAYALKRGAALRVNAAQQKQKYSTDTGFDYLVDLIANPKAWLSVKFQSL